MEDEDNPPVRYDEQGRPLFSYNVPGGPLPADLPRVRVPKLAEFERGSAKDTNR
jgi:hypothetical protein